jgi:20S proteasome alpha/beta subunit
MVSTDMQRIFKMQEKLFVGLSGFASDVQTVCVCVVI